MDDHQRRFAAALAAERHREEESLLADVESGRELTRFLAYMASSPNGTPLDGFDMDRLFDWLIGTVAYVGEMQVVPEGLSWKQCGIHAKGRLAYVFFFQVGGERLTMTAVREGGVWRSSRGVSRRAEAATPPT